MTRTSDTQYDNTREERYAISPSLLWQPDTTPRCCCAPTCKKIRRAAITVRCRWTAPAMRTTGVSSPPAPTKAIRQTGISAASRSTATSLTHQFNDVWSAYSAGSYTHTNVSLDQVYQVGWIDDSDSWRAATAARAARWTAGQPITACAPISIPATWRIP
jgi:iron complex outermembrane receptor protein